MAAATKPPPPVPDALASGTRGQALPLWLFFMNSTALGANEKTSRKARADTGIPAWFWFVVLVRAWLLPRAVVLELLLLLGRS